MWKLGLRRRYSQKRNTKVWFSLQCVCNNTRYSFLQLFFYTCIKRGTVHCSVFSLSGIGFLTHHILKCWIIFVIPIGFEHCTKVTSKLLIRGAWRLPYHNLNSTDFKYCLRPSAAWQRKSLPISDLFVACKKQQEKSAIAQNTTPTPTKTLHWDKLRSIIANYQYTARH